MIPRTTFKQLEFDKILAEIATHAHGSVTCERIAAIAPLGDFAMIQEISGRIGEIRALLAQGISLRLTPFEDIRPLLEAVRPSGAYLGPHELLLFIPAVQIFTDISRQLSPRSDIPLLAALTARLRPFPEILEPLAASIDHDASIMDSASSPLREIRRAKRSLATRIRKKIEEIVRHNDIEIFLQDDFITQRSGRWVIPVRMDSKGMVRGVVHDVSASGETAFMEPLEIIPFVNELENLSAEEKAEEIRILRQLSAWIREEAGPLEECFAVLVTLDLLNSMARFAEQYGLESPHLNTDGRLCLAQARHPLLMMLQRRGNITAVEPLDLLLEENNVMVITGPNAGGKTIALKTAGILTLMALSAIPVPVNGARSTFPLLNTLLVDIGDEQSIEQSLSTFSAHVARIASILEQSGQRSLVLLDELGAGTEPHQGAAIACGVLRELQERGAMVLATTHLTEIIGFVHRMPGMTNAGMEYDAETYTPLYRLISGEPGQSHAVDIARRYGMPERVISFARELLGSAGGELATLLAELRLTREQLGEQQRLLEQERTAVAAERDAVEARAGEIERARREASEKAWDDARELISATRRRMNELLEDYKRDRRAETIERIRLSQQELAEKLEPRVGAAGEQVAVRDLVPGSRVHVPSLGHDGTVLSLDERTGKARVATGSMEVDVPLATLLAPLKPGTAKSGRKTGRSSLTIEVADEGDRELKLIGLRADEALDLLEPFLNRASLGGLREVRIIHGVGTGKLRQAVREHLERHPLVAEFRPGGAHEGRDGATVVTLRH
jgi:DNA mismatch repair protein MutS2